MGSFNQLAAQLSQKPGVTNPGGLAASIGRAKMGKAAFDAKAAAGRKKQHTQADVMRQMGGR